MAHRNIKSSLLRRIRRIPRMAPFALQSYTDTGSDNAGVFRITIPNETFVPMKVIDARGIYNFGGLSSESDEVYLTKIVIDGITVYEKHVSDTLLRSVFSTNGNVNSSGYTINGNTPPFLINERLEIYAVNYESISRHPRWGSSSKIINIAIVPIQ